MHSVGQLAVRVTALELDDTLGKAAEAIRSSHVGAALVVHLGGLLGLVTAAGLAEVVAERPSAELATLRVADLPIQRAAALPESFSAENALSFLRANGLERAPVVEYSGQVIGIITPAELASAVCRRVRPPLIGGMATPFGVYLTGGGVRGGVGDLALMSTGVYMGTLHLVSLVALGWLLEPGGWIDRLPAVFNWVVRNQQVVQLLLFGLLFRLTWVTGYHAAEHQVVHAIEAGEELLPEVVREKPRVHPRCGTNLVTAVMIMWAFWDSTWWRTVTTGLGPLPAMIITAFLWRRVGGVVQQWVTTRPASPKQIASGIRAGRELIDRYQEPVPTSRWLLRRIWNMGLLQVMGGYTLLFLFVMLLQALHFPLPPVLQDLRF